MMRQWRGGMRGTSPAFPRKVQALWMLCMMLALLARSVSAEQSFAPRAQAADFKEEQVYHSPEKPGYCAWVQLWRDTDGNLMVAFNEKRADKDKPKRGSADPKSMEDMGLSAKYDFTDLISETMYLRSTDEGTTWEEASRTAHGVITPVSLADGRLLSVTWGMPGWLRESADVGRTWHNVRELMDPRYFDVFPFVMRLLADQKTLVIVCPFAPAWGSGKPLPTRISQIAGVQKFQAAFFWSTDFGRTLIGPIGLFPGVPVTEPDFCELPSGDLLFVHHRMYSGTCHRQLVRRTSLGLVPDPMEESSMNTPEIFVRTLDGYLVGASRNGAYRWSDDDGLTWYPVEDAPNCNYQPRAVTLRDGRVMFAWHKGADLAYQETDMWIGRHVFRLDVLHPRKRTTLTIARVFDEEQNRYRNAFTATLATQDGKPVVGKSIEFSIVGRDSPGYAPYGGGTPWVHGRKTIAVTDASGTARVDYPEQDEITETTKSFQVCARFDPEHNDPDYIASTSVVMEYYAFRKGE